jgi:hypothetical protein
MFNSLKTVVDIIVTLIILDRGLSGGFAPKKLLVAILAVLRKLRDFLENVIHGMGKLLDSIMEVGELRFRSHVI